MQQNFSDKEIIGDALASQKLSTSYYNTFANECAHENLRSVTMNVLQEEHDIQAEVFEMMHARGYYPTPEAQEKKVQEARQKYQACVKPV